MPENRNLNHPNLDLLLAFSEGSLSEKESAGISQHLELCVQCRLEIKCARRFNELGENPLDDHEVQWDRAELELERVWREKIQPQVSENSSLERPGWRSSLIWLMPAVAAAVVALVFLVPSLTSDLSSLPAVSPAIRGAEDNTGPQISLNFPSRDLESRPQQFSWQTDVKCDHFTLEVFTSDLKTVFVKTELEGSSWALTEEVEDLLEANTIYLWKVQGFSQFKPIAESGNNWFRFPLEEQKK